LPEHPPTLLYRIKHSAPIAFTLHLPIEVTAATMTDTFPGAAAPEVFEENFPVKEAYRRGADEAVIRHSIATLTQSKQIAINQVGLKDREPQDPIVETHAQLKPIHPSPDYCHSTTSSCHESLKPSRIRPSSMVCMCCRTRHMAHGHMLSPPRPLHIQASNAVAVKVITSQANLTIYDSPLDSL